MTALTWDGAGERMYETGVDHGVLYLANEGGDYDTGFAWNGLVTVTESPTGAEATALYADNIKYLNLQSVEEFGATIEAYTYPDEFAECDGSAQPETGVMIGQQTRRLFGLSYRTRMGNDLEGTAYGYKLHLVYNALAAPSEKAYATINDTPEAITFSWEVSTTPATVTGFQPTASITIDSTKVDAADLAELEDFLYGTVGTDPSLPSPDAVIAIFAGALVEAVPTEPTFANGDEITIPTVTGVIYKRNGITVPAGVLTITEDTVITAVPAVGYKFPAVVDDDWFYEYTP
jgi:hypothetical protein